MSTSKTLCINLFLCFQVSITLAQSDTSFSTQQALVFADSLVQANFYQKWDVYTSLSCPSAIKYYGGAEGFREHIVEMYYRNEPVLEEKPESLRMVTIMTDLVNEWQCVIEKERNTYGEDKRKEKIFTYLVGQSTDNGQTWKFIDVSHDDIRNVIYIMPKIFGSLAIPEKRIVYDDEVIARKDTTAKHASKKIVATPKKP